LYISEDLSDQLQTSCCALQTDKATDVVKDVYVITYVWYVLENYMKEDFSLCKPSDSRPMSL